jgi:hypothetical protein
VDEAVIESHDVSSSDRQGVTSILWKNTAKLCNARAYKKERGIKSVLQVTRRS